MGWVSGGQDRFFLRMGEILKKITSLDHFMQENALYSLIHYLGNQSDVGDKEQKS